MCDNRSHCLQPPTSLTFLYTLPQCRERYFFAYLILHLLTSTHAALPFHTIQHTNLHHTTSTHTNAHQHTSSHTLPQCARGKIYNHNVFKGNQRYPEVFKGRTMYLNVKKELTQAYICIHTLTCRVGCYPLPPGHTCSRM
jgi:hypothetical protein